VLARIDIETLQEGVYTIRIVAQDALLGNLTISVFVNVRPDGSGDPFDDPFNPGGNNGNSGGGVIQPAQPTGTQECIGGCGDPPLLVICGPRGWFIDKNRDYNNVNNWQSGFIDGTGSLTAAAERVCNG
jgi:hypothetical protein